MTHELRRSWFAARILLESIHPDEPGGHRLFEDRIVLVRARTEEEALKKAQRVGEKAKTEYPNQYGQRVIWEFREVLQIEPLFEDTIRDGSQVYYSLIGERELEWLRQLLAARAE